MDTKTKRAKTARKAPSRPPLTSADIAGGMGLLKLAGKIRGHLNAADAGPSRKDRAVALIEHLETGNMTSSDYILMAQYIRDMGGMGEDQIFAGVASFVEEIAWEDWKINMLSKAIDAKYKEYGAEDDEYWPAGEAPEDMEELRAAFDSRFLQLQVAILRRHGEDEMSDFLFNDPDAFQDRVERGRKIIKKRGLGK